MIHQPNQRRCGPRTLSGAGHLNLNDSDNGKGRRQQMAYAEREVSVTLISFALLGIHDEKLQHRKEQHHRVLNGLNKGSRPGNGHDHGTKTGAVRKKKANRASSTVSVQREFAGKRCASS